MTYEASSDTRSRGDRGEGAIPNDRLMTFVLGGGLALWGVKRGGLIGLIGAGVGTYLLARGAGQTEIGREAMDRAGEALSGRGNGAVSRTIVIGKPRAEVYAFYRNFKNLERFMSNIERIDVLDDKRSHWVVKAPVGGTVEWDSRITEEQENELIAWEAEEGAPMRNRGRVSFRDARDGQATLLSATIEMQPPVEGAIGKAVSSLLRAIPGIQMQTDLERLKRVLEGEASSSGSQQNGGGAEGVGNSFGQSTPNPTQGL